MGRLPIAVQSSHMEFLFGFLMKVKETSRIRLDSRRMRFVVLCGRFYHIPFRIKAIDILKGKFYYILSLYILLLQLLVLLLLCAAVKRIKLKWNNPVNYFRINMLIRRDRVCLVSRPKKNDFVSEPNLFSCKICIHILLIK